MVSKTKGLVLGGEVRYLKRTAGIWLLHSLGGILGSLPWIDLNWFIFIIRLGGRKLGPRMIQESDFYTIISQNSKITFYLTWVYKMTGWRAAVSLLVEDEVPKLWDL